MLKIAVKYGLICAVLMIVPTIIQMIIGVDKIWTNGLISLAMYIIVIWLVIKAVKEYRTECENRITFKSAFNIALTSFLIVAVISMGFAYVYQNYIDPNAGQKAKEMAIQKMEERMNNNPNITEDQKVTMMDKFENADPTFTPLKALKLLGWSMGIYLVISLIIAASIKKDLNENEIPIV